MPDHFDYKLNVNVEKGVQLFGQIGKTFYEAKWIQPREPQIILIEMDNETAYHEASFYIQLNSHDHIIHTFGFVDNDLHLPILLQERAPFGNLSALLQQNRFKPSQQVLVEIFNQIVDAMIYIVAQNIVHGDLCCHNVLVFKMNSNKREENLVKLTNYHNARSIDQPIKNDDRITAPIRYCAVEILRSAGRSNYSELSDVYSMGVLMWEACSQVEIPYTNISNIEIRQRKLRGEKLQRPYQCDDHLWLIVQDCWHNEPDLRYTFSEIKVRLSNIKIEKPSISYDFALNIDVKQGALMPGTRKNNVYNAEWLLRKGPKIVLIKKEEDIATREIEFYRQLKIHPRIIQVFGLVDSKSSGSIFLLQECASHGNLSTLLRENHFKPLPIVLVEIFSQLLDAVAYISSKKIVHGNLCCRNVLVFKMNPYHRKGNSVKLTNFDYAQFMDHLKNGKDEIIATVRYCAPEILESEGQSKYSEASDVYSLGVLMWEACSKGKLPYASIADDNEVRQRKLSGEKLSKPDNFDEKIWELIQMCWATQTDLRFNFAEMRTLISRIKPRVAWHYKYNLNIDIQKGVQLFGQLGKSFYQAAWSSRHGSPIILIEMDHETAYREASFYIQLNHNDHIVHTFGFVNNNRHLPMLLQERAPFHNLSILLQENGFQPSQEVLIEIFGQIVDAMIYIAGKNIVHGDLCCRNVLVFKMNSNQRKGNLVKVTNFHNAQHTDETLNDNDRLIIPVRYCAPEILHTRGKSNYSEASDVYSMGVLMWEAYSQGEIPYANMSNNEIRQRRLRGEQLQPPSKCHTDEWTLITQCCLQEPEIRWTFFQIQSLLSSIRIK
ncbi:unnamed protein product [Rotaria sp. Silwood1]|nr:unnamed protein product [Rotaria sp. Silwood1]